MDSGMTLSLNDVVKAVREIAAHKIAVTDSATRAAACEFLRELKRRKDTVTEFFADAKRKAAETHKAICAQEKSLLDPLKAADGACRNAISAWDAAEAERMRAERERLDKAAAAELAKAAELEAGGDSEGAAEAVARAAMHTASIGAAEYSEGVSARTEWKARVIDESLVPREYLIVDLKAINAYARATKGRGVIPGVEFYTARVLSVRA